MSKPYNGETLHDLRKTKVTAIKIKKIAMQKVLATNLILYITKISHL